MDRPALGACDPASGLCVSGGGGGGETDCTDFSDNDGDTLTDCEDPTSCQGLPICQPGPGAVGLPCDAPNDCQAAAGSDPERRRPNLGTLLLPGLGFRVVPKP